MSENISESLAEAQFKKLQLEIEDLKNKRKLSYRVLQYLPIITTLVAVIGLSLATLGYLSDREKERESNKKDREAREAEQRIRDENQIRTNIDQLLSLDSNQLAAKVPYLLNDLAVLIKRQPEEERTALEQRVTETIVQFISKDAEILTPRLVRTDIHAINNWSGYRHYLINNPHDNSLIMDNYIEAFADLYKKDKTYFSKVIDYKNGAFDIGQNKRTDRSLFFQFTELVEGLSMHLFMPGTSPEDRKYYVEQFQDAINNPIITKHLIESNDFPKP